MAIHDAEYLKERFSDLKTPIGSEFSDLIDSCINYTVSGVVGFYSLSAVNVAVLSSFSVLSGGNSNQWDSVYTTVQENSALWGEINSTTDTGVRSLTSNWENAYTTVQENSSTWDYQGTDIKTLTSGWVGGNSAYTTLQTYSAYWEESSEILPTVTNYLSTNNVQLSALTINDGSLIATLYVKTSKVGINTETPNEALTIVGNISSTGLLYGDGSNLTGIIAGDVVATTLVRNNSANWHSTYTTVYANSSTWDYQGNDLKSLSSTWDNTYTNVNTNSAKWESVYTNVNSNSSTNVKTLVTTSGLSSVTTIVAVSAIPSIQLNGTLYILI